MTHPILSLVSRREFLHLVRQVQLCEIAWPQCYEYGHPIQLGGDYGNAKDNRGMLSQARTDAQTDTPGDDDDGETQGASATSLELRHGSGEGTREGN